MNRIDAIRRLHRLGHAPEYPESDARFLEWCIRDLGQELISRYQQWHKLPVCGKMTEETRLHLEAPRCGHADVMAITSESAWAVRSLSYWQQIIYPGVDQAEIAEDYAEAIRRLTAVCGVEITQTLNQAAAQIRARSGPIDGAWNVLALTELPPMAAGPSTVLNQKFDIAEVSLTKDQRIAMMCHEAGHFLGLGHAPPGTGALMEPILGSIASPQAWDIRELQERYGPPVPSSATPSPAPTPPPGTNGIPAAPAAPGPDVSTVIMQIPAPGSYHYVFTFDQAGTYLVVITPTR
jgi:hypothetical protein